MTLFKSFNLGFNEHKILNSITFQKTTYHGPIKRLNAETIREDQI